jgi:hypothetical protein
MCNLSAYEEQSTDSDANEIRNFREAKADFDFTTDPSTCTGSTFKPDQTRILVVIDNRSEELKQITSEINYLSSVLEIGDIIFKNGRDVTDEELNIINSYYDHKYKVIENE